MEKKGILVYLEGADGSVVKASLEALNAAEKLAAKNGKSIAAVLINNAAAADLAAGYGAGSVISVSVSGEYNPESYANALADIANEYEPEFFFAGATREGKDVMARVAAMTECGVVTDAIDMDGEGWVRSVYGGSLFESVKFIGNAVIIVRSGTFGKPDFTEGAKADVIEAAAKESDILAVIKETVKEIGDAVNLEDAEVIVAGGRGMGNEENFKLVEQLAEAFGGVVGATRPAIEAGWVSRDHQVGQSGKIVAPKLYFACGISGAVQHVSGMSGSGYIVAINKDEDAPIFEVADCGIVGSCTDILPLLIEEVKKRRA